MKFKWYKYRIKMSRALNDITFILRENIEKEIKKETQELKKEIQLLRNEVKTLKMCSSKSGLQTCQNVTTVPLKTIKRNIKIETEQTGSFGDTK